MFQIKSPHPSLAPFGRDEEDEEVFWMPHDSRLSYLVSGFRRMSPASTTGAPAAVLLTTSTAV